MPVVYRLRLEHGWRINTGVSAGKMCSGRRKNHGCEQKKQKALALLYLTFGPPPNAANSSSVPTKITEGDQLSSSISSSDASPSHWLVWIFSFVTAYSSQLFGLQSTSALQQNTTKMKSSKANFVTWTLNLPLKRQLSDSFKVFLSILRY